MKIAILAFLFPPKWIAGTEIASYNIAKYLAKRGHEIHVITSLDKSLPRESKEEGFHIHRVSCLGIKYFGIPSFWIASLPCLRKVNPDIIHIQNTTVGIAGFLNKILFRKPYVISAQGGDIYRPWLLIRLSSRLVFRQASAVIALTEHMKREMQKIHNCEITVLPNGVELESVKSTTLPKTVRRKSGLDETAEIILFVGRLHIIKGVKYLIEALKIISQKYTSTRLVLVGEGEERQRLQEMVKGLGLSNRVSFVGSVPNRKVAEYMSAADVFVLPSLSEGFPVVIPEAMAAGLPIVTTNVRGLPEIVKDGENGFTVDPQNSQQLAEKISLLLDDKELRQKISRNNRRKARQYSWETVVEKLEKVYLNAIDSHS